MNTGANTNEVAIRSEDLEPPSWSEQLSRYIQILLNGLDIENWEVSVLLCDEALMQHLNATYRGKDESTDVLSFVDEDSITNTDPPVDRVYAGDIVICVPCVEMQATEAGVEYEEELRRVTIHGILHLAGYTHDSNDFETESMLKLQEKLLFEVKETLF